MSNLVLLTSNFPYGKGETFLKSEVPFLSEHFENVYILPTHSYFNDQSFNFPKNVKILKVDFKLNKLDKILAVRFLFVKAIMLELLLRRKNGMRWNSIRFKTMLISYAKAKRITNFLISNQFGSEAVFYSYWCDDSAIALAQLKCKNPLLKCVSRAHGWDVYEEVSSIQYLPFRSFISENLDAIYPVSISGAKEINEKWRRSIDQKVTHRYLGVKTDHFLNPPKTENVLRIASCSNLIPLKRIHLIIEALSKKPPCIIVEWNHFGSGFLYQSLYDRCVNEFHENTIFKFHGNVDNASLLDWYNKNHVDVFINVSETEGIPVSIMEAMSKGIPVIATNVGGSSEIVTTENGILLSPFLTSDELLEVVLMFNDLNQEEKNRKRKAAHETWNKLFNAEQNYTCFAEELANRKS